MQVGPYRHYAKLFWYANDTRQRLFRTARHFAFTPGGYWAGTIKAVAAARMRPLKIVVKLLVILLVIIVILLLTVLTSFPDGGRKARRSNRLSPKVYLFDKFLP